MGSQSRPFEVRRVAVIGAGPCGLAAAKYLAAQGAFENIVVYEQNAEVGGVWDYSEKPSQTLRVPQVSAFCPPDPPVQLSNDEPPVFPTPLYNTLHANIPGSLMQFSDLAFPKSSLVFPSREDIQNYLRDYSRDVQDLIKFCTTVEDVQLRQDGGRDLWDVTFASTVTGERSTTTFDALVVASGHYSTTYIPDIPAIEAFHQAHPTVITHAKLYRSPQPFAKHKVVVVGNAASGWDIASQINHVCEHTVLLSVRTPTVPENLEYSGCEEVPEIEEFLPQQRGVRFRGGRVEENIDTILFATGYLFSFPFAASWERPLVTDGRRVYGLWKDLVHIEHPTLAFPGLPIKVVPFSLAESQGAILARAWSNSLELPSEAEMKRWEEDEEQKRGHAFHVFPKGGDLDYVNSTYDWLSQSGSPGKVPPRWNDELAWQRQIYFEAKLAFEKGGRVAMSLEELGFEYRPSPDLEKGPEIL